MERESVKDFVSLQILEELVIVFQNYVFVEVKLKNNVDLHVWKLLGMFNVVNVNCVSPLVLVSIWIFWMSKVIWLKACTYILDDVL